MKPQRQYSVVRLLHWKTNKTLSKNFKIKIEHFSCHKAASLEMIEMKSMVVIYRLIYQIPKGERNGFIKLLENYKQDVEH